MQKFIGDFAQLKKYGFSLTSKKNENSIFEPNFYSRTKIIARYLNCVIHKTVCINVKDRTIHFYDRTGEVFDVYWASDLENDGLVVEE